eukprot:gene11079-3145_t
MPLRSERGDHIEKNKGRRQYKAPSYVPSIDGEESPVPRIKKLGAETTKSQQSRPKTADSWESWDDIMSKEDDVASPIPGNVAPSPTTSRLEMTRPEANQQQATVVRHSSDWDFSDEEEIAKSTEIHHTTFKSSNQKSFSIRHEKDNKSDNEIKENRPENVEWNQSNGDTRKEPAYSSQATARVYSKDLPAKVPVPAIEEPNVSSESKMRMTAKTTGPNLKGKLKEDAIGMGNGDNVISSSKERLRPWISEKPRKEGSPIRKAHSSLPTGRSKDPHRLQGQNSVEYETNPSLEGPRNREEQYQFFPLSSGVTVTDFKETQEDISHDGEEGKGNGQGVVASQFDSAFQNGVEPIHTHRVENIEDLVRHGAFHLDIENKYRKVDPNSPLCGHYVHAHSSKISAVVNSVATSRTMSLLLTSKSLIRLILENYRQEPGETHLIWILVETAQKLQLDKSLPMHSLARALNTNVSYTTQFGIQTHRNYWFAGLRTVVDIVLVLLFEIITFVLYVLRKVFVETVVLISDVFFKPLLHAFFNGVLHPLLVFVLNIAGSISKILAVVFTWLDPLVLQLERLLRAFRLVEVHSAGVRDWSKDMRV